MPSEINANRYAFNKAWGRWRNKYGWGVNTGARDALWAEFQAELEARREGRTIPRPPCPERDAVLARGREKTIGGGDAD